MAYCDTSSVRKYLGASDTNDDPLLESLISAAQKIIDGYCGRTFEATEDTTRYFDAYADVRERVLWLDHDLCSITSITNGDGTTLSESHYVTEPRNSSTYYAIRLKTSSGKLWLTNNSSDHENAIAIVGKWAYSETAPDSVAHACKRLVAYLYRQKDNAGDLDRAVIAGNSTILPAQIPSDIKLILAPYKRVTK